MTRQFTPEERAIAVEQFLKLKAEGKTIDQIEAQLGIGNSNLYKWTGQAKQQSKELKRATMLPESAKPPKKGLDGRYPDELREKALQMLESGKRVHEVAREFKLNPQTVYYWKSGKGKRNGTLIPAGKPVTRVNGIGGGGEMQDALIYLRHAEREIMDMVKEGKIARPDQAHLLTLLALGALQKSLGR